jgi:hypothetical protein
MPRIREFEFVTGIETSEAPSVADPSSSGDLVTLGYADDHYTHKDEVWGTAATNAVIKAIPAADRADGQILYHIGVLAFYRFNSASAAADDGNTVLAPDVGTGRWLKQAVFASADDARVDKIYPIVLGSSAEVTAGNADYSDWASAHTAAATGDRIHLLKNAGFDTGTKVVTKRLLISGQGAGSVMDGDFQFSTGSEGSIIKDMTIDGDLIIDSGVTGIQAKDGLYLTAGKTFEDNNLTGNKLSAMQEY